MTRTSTRTPRRSLAAAAALATCLAALGAAPLGAQAAASAPDPRWQPWYGCWAPDADPLDGPSVAPVTCVSPAGGSAVEIVTVANGKVTGRDRLVADGAPHPITREGCQGSERATWSADGRRVYLHSEQACGNNVRRSGDGILAFAGAGDWIDVRAAKIGGYDYTGVRSIRYQPTTPPAALPADVSAALTRQASAAEEARLPAVAPVGTAAVIEANRAVGAAATGAWIAELHQQFALNARELVALADAGVPGSVTDVMIATSKPNVFALGPSGAERVAGTTPRTGRQIPVTLTPPGSWGGWGWDGFGSPGYGYGYGRGYGRGAYGYGYGYGPGGYYGNGNYPGGWWGSGPVVVVVRPTPAGPSAGIARGRGYTQGDAPSYGTARGSGASASDGGRASTSSSGGGSSAGSSSSGSSSSGSGSLGTAKPRP